MGVNLVYAPVCDLATNPRNPVVGIRSFGDDPAAVGRLAAASVRGLQSAGVAATVKHLPGHGEPGGDSHLGLPVIEASVDELRARELVPFDAAIRAGARVAMAGHLAVPALTGRRDLPATLAREIVTNLLRGELGFDGVAVSDALDMGGVQGGDGGPDVAAALAAGTDLLLCGPDPTSQRRVEAGLAAAIPHLDAAEAAAARDRLDDLRRWLAGFDAAPIEVVGSAAHRALAHELARRSITRIRDRVGLLGQIVAADARILVIEAQPVDLTPADTTSRIKPGGLAAALRATGRRRVPGVVVADPVPTSHIPAIRELAAEADLIVLGTVDALGRPTIVELAHALVGTGRPLIGVALRAPWDADAYPDVGTVIATYGIQPPTLAAAAAAILDGAPLSGRPPVRLGAAS
jgi:beta-N-acetylhexosaminidase